MFISLLGMTLSKSNSKTGTEGSKDNNYNVSIIILILSDSIMKMTQTNNIIGISFRTIFPADER